MSDSEQFEVWSLGGGGEAGAEAVLAEAGKLLDAAAAAGEATLVELDASFRLGWHPLLGRFRVAARMDGAPGHLPAWLAALEEARHVHAGGDRPEGAVAALLALVRETSGKL